MKQAHRILQIQTSGEGMTSITREITDWVADQGILDGVLTVFVQHTSASLTIQENADSDVQTDLQAFMSRLVPCNTADYRHTAEGPDDMPAHIKTSLTDVQLSIPVMNGQPALGTWQGIYLLEHRRHPHRRRIVLHLIGE